MPETNITTLFRSREIGEPFHVIRKKACKSFLQQDFGVDVSKIPDEDLEHTHQRYQADYESFLARNEMSDGHDTIALAIELLNKKNPYLTSGKKGAELLRIVLEKMDHVPVSNQALRGLRYQSIPENGPCLFHAIGVSLGEDAASLRESVVEYMEANFAAVKEFYRLGNDDDFRNYIEAVRNGNEQGDDVEIKIIQDALQIPIIIIRPDTYPTIPNNIADSEDDPIFIRDNGHNHYDAYIIEDDSDPTDILTSINADIENSKQICTRINKRLNIRLQNAAIKTSDEINNSEPEIFSEKKDREKSPLHLAAELGDVVAVKKILDGLATETAKKAACQKKDIYGRTPLHWAAQSESSDAVESILAVFPTEDEKRNACEEKDNNKNTALHLAAQSKNPKNFNKIWGVFADDEDEEKKHACLDKNSDEATPVGLAVMSDNLEAFERMWGIFTNDEKKRIIKEDISGEENSSEDDSSENYNSAASISDENSSEDNISEDGISESEDSASEDNISEEEDHQSVVLLHVASMCKNAEIFEKIWAVYTDNEKKLICQKRFTDCFVTALHLAAAFGNSRIIGSMLDIHTAAEQKKVCQKVDDDGHTVLQYAILSDNPTAFEKIFAVFKTPAEKRQSCQAEDYEGHTSLHFAAMRGNPEIFERILGVFATVEEKIAACKKETNDGANVVDFAIYHADNPMLILKIIEDLSPELIDELMMMRPRGKHPLVSAVELGKAETAEYLLEFLPANFSLEDALDLLTLSQRSKNFVTQKIVINKIISMLVDKSNDDQQQFLSTHGDVLLKACKECGNTPGFNTVADMSLDLGIEAISANLSSSFIERMKSPIQDTPLAKAVKRGKAKTAEYLFKFLPGGFSLEDALVLLTLSQESGNIRTKYVVTDEITNMLVKKSEADQQRFLSANRVILQEVCDACGNTNSAKIIDALVKKMWAAERLAGEKLAAEGLREIMRARERLIAARRKNACEEDDHQNTALHFAAQSKNPENFNKIWALFANDEEKKLACLSKNSEGLTPLHIAIQFENLEAFKKMWNIFEYDEKKYLSEEEDHTGSTLLFLAATYKNKEIFEIILAVSKTGQEKKQACLSKNSEGMTPLHFAAFAGSSEIIDSIFALLTDEEKKAACEKENDQGLTVVHCAVISKNPRAFEKIFGVFTDAEIRQLCGEINDANDDEADRDRSAPPLLHLAAGIGNPEIFKRILGVFETDEDKITACEKEDDFGSIVDVTIEQADNPVSILEIIEKLSRELIDEPMKRPIKDTPLALAVENGKAETAEYLFKFLPDDFSLEDARVLLRLSQESRDSNSATQNVVTKKITSMLENQAEETQAASPTASF